MNQSSITVTGLASSKIVKIISIPNNFPDDLSLMNFLIANGVTIASSCGGVGSCRKCIVNSTFLSCQIRLKEFINTTPSKEVEISYL